MAVSLRPADPSDLAFAQRLYYAEMRWIVERLFGWDDATEDVKFARQFVVDETRIITLDGRDIGWLQSAVETDQIFLKQIYVTGEFQRRGIGTQIMQRLFEEADRHGKPVTLGVVKINPALALYQRLGFRTTHEDQYKFYMRRDAGQTRAD